VPTASASCGKAAPRAGHRIGRDQVARLTRTAGIHRVRRSRRVRPPDPPHQPTTRPAHRRSRTWWSNPRLLSIQNRASLAPRSYGRGRFGSPTYTCHRRSPTGDSESDADALARELDEALIETTTVRAYRVRQTGGTVQPNDHRALRWVSADELGDLAWIPADRAWLPDLSREHSARRPTGRTHPAAGSSPGTWCTASSCDSSTSWFRRSAPPAWPPVLMGSRGRLVIC
jgi:hypothetical protein